MLSELVGAAADAVVIYDIIEHGWTQATAANELGAYSTHRDHFVQAIVITRSSDRDRSEATLGTSVS